MKKLFRVLLCGVLMAAALSVSAFAVEDDILLISPGPTTIAPAPAALPELQGDFYVLVNGEYVTFTDAVPKIKNDRSCLPFVAVFEQLGFAESDMTWDHDTKTVTATKGDLTVSLTIGKSEIIIIKGGETTVVPTDVAPYIEPALSRTYIPFGLVADALHYAVGWDANVRAVIIDDVDAIMAENTETYELMDKYLAYTNSLMGAKNTKISGTYNGAFVLSELVEGQQLDMEFLVDGNYSALMNKNYVFDFDTDVDLSMQAYLDGANITKSLKEAGELPKLPDTMDFAMTGDYMSGAFYFNSAALCKLLEQPDMANAWFKMDLASIYQTLGINYSELIVSSLQTAGEASFKEILTGTLKNTTLTSIDATTADTLAVINALVGDSAFTKDGRNYVNEMYLYEDGAAVVVNLTLNTNSTGSKVTGCGMYFGLLAADATAEITCEMKDSSMTLEMVMDMPTTETSGVVLILEMDGTYKSVTKAPAGKPADGSVIIDLFGDPDAL